MKVLADTGGSSNKTKKNKQDAPNPVASLNDDDAKKLQMPPPEKSVDA